MNIVLSLRIRSYLRYLKSPQSRVLVPFGASSTSRNSQLSTMWTVTHYAFP